MYAWKPLLKKDLQVDGTTSRIISPPVEPVSNSSNLLSARGATLDARQRPLAGSDALRYLSKLL